MKLGWTEGGIQVGWLHDTIRRELQGSEQTEMPKRKADQSVDEWLEEGTSALEANRTLTTVNCNPERDHPLSTAERQPTGKAIDPNTEASPNVASSTYVTPPESEVATADATPAPAEVATDAKCPTVRGVANKEDVA